MYEPGLGFKEMASMLAGVQILSTTKLYSHQRSSAPSFQWYTNVMWTNTRVR